jgi:hypothetical protein
MEHLLYRHRRSMPFHARSAAAGLGAVLVMVTPPWPERLTYRPLHPVRRNVFGLLGQPGGRGHNPDAVAGAVASADSSARADPVCCSDRPSVRFAANRGAGYVRRGSHQSGGASSSECPARPGGPGEPADLAGLVVGGAAFAAPAPLKMMLTRVVPPRKASVEVDLYPPGNAMPPAPGMSVAPSTSAGVCPMGGGV